MSTTKPPANPSPLPPISSENDILPGLETWRRVLAKAIGTAPTPGKVISFTATPAVGGIQLAWQKSQDADGYIIERSSTINFTPFETIAISGGAQITYFDPFPSVSTEYYRIYSTSGTTSAPHSVRSQVSIIAKATSQSPAGGGLTGSLRYVSTFSGVDIGAKINAAIAVGPGHIICDIGGLQTTPVQITVNNVWLEGNPGVVITKGVNGVNAPPAGQITIAANGCRVSGFILDGNKAGGFVGPGIWDIGNNNEVDHNVIKNQANGGPGGLGLLASNPINFNYHDNTISACDGATIGIGVVTNNVIAGPGRCCNNFCDASTSVGSNIDCIGLNPQALNSAFTGVVIDNNNLITGSGFGVELFTSAGATGNSNCSVSNNVIKIGQNGNGGISISGATDCVVIGNTINCNGFSVGLTLEIAGSNGCSIVGNHINCTQTANVGILLNSASSNNTISSNTVVNVADAFQTIGITIINSTGHADNNTIVGNTIIMGNTSVNANYAIWLQSNNAAATINRNVISSNVCIGNGNASSWGILMEMDSGAMDGCSIIANVVQHSGQGIGLTTGVTNCIVLANRVLSATLPYLFNSTDPSTGSVLASGQLNSAVMLRSGGTPAQGFDFNLDNGGTQPHAGVPWMRLGGGSNDSPIFNAGTSSGEIAFNLDQPSAFVNIGGGGLLLGGVIVKSIHSYTPTITPASVPASSVNEQSFTVTGITATDRVFFNPPAQSNSAVPLYMRVSGANTVVIGFGNHTAGALTPVSGQYLIIALTF